MAATTIAAMAAASGKANLARAHILWLDFASGGFARNREASGRRRQSEFFAMNAVPRVTALAARAIVSMSCVLILDGIRLGAKN